MKPARTKGRQRESRSAQGFTGLALFESARDHMRSAQLLFASSPYCFDSAGFLAQLSIESLLKAELLHITGACPAEHDLLRLLRRLQTEVPEVSVSRRARSTLERLSEFGGLRYPQPSAPIEIGRDDLEPIIALFKNIWQSLPSQLRPAPDRNELVTKHQTRVLMRRSKARPPNKRLQPAARALCSR